MNVLKEEELVDNSKLGIKTARTFGGATYLVLTGYVDSGKKYIVRKEIYSRKEKRITKIIIQSIEDAKYICQNWNDIHCEECESLTECELNKLG